MSFPDARITIYDAFAQNVLILDAVSDSEIGNNADIQYENTPTGCGAAEIPLKLTYSQIVAKGYWRAYNVVEISTADNVMTHASLSGATKIYIDSNAPFRSTNDPDTQMVYFWDGASLCMLVPVTGHGTDGGGDFINVGTPGAGGGNPGTLPAYGIGTYVGRRRWSGRIMRRSRPNQKNPIAKVTLVGWGASGGPFDKTVDTFSITETDHGQAIYDCISNAFSGRTGASLLTINNANFPSIDAAYSSHLAQNVSIGDTKWYVNSVAGLIPGDNVTIGSGGGAETRVVLDVSDSGGYFTTKHVATKNHSAGDAATSPASDGFTGSLQNTQLSQMLNEILTSIATGDIWVVRVSHDRTPRLLQLYVAATDTYTYTKVLPQGVTAFEPVGVEADDEDATNIFNSIEVIGNTDPTTGQPAAAIVQDPESMRLYGQIDAVPVTVTGLQTVDDCAAFGQGLLNQSSIPISNNKFRVYIRNDGSPTNQPAGLANGDVLIGVEAVVITRFDDTGTVYNMVPDSEVQYPSGNDALWTPLNGGLTSDPLGGPTGTGAWKITGTGSALSQQQEYSQPIDVVPGQTYTLSGWFNGSHLTSGGPSWDIYDPTVTTRYAAIQATPGATGTVSTTWTVPNGVYQVVLVANARTATVASGQPFRWAQPQLQLGNTLLAYVPNYAAPNLYGLVASAVTTIDPHGDRYQDVKFAAVEPDWTAEMAERAHGLANALRNNQKLPVQIDQYCVSTDAFPTNANGHLNIPTTGLTVNPPDFLALFLPNSNILTVSSPTFVVGASSTNWCWLNPDLTWTIQQDPSSVAGSILVYIFATNASRVIGQTAKAPVGVFKIGLGNINDAANLPAPSVTNDGALTNVPSQHPTQADIEATVDINNVPQTQDIPYGLYWAFREHGTSTWTVYAEIDLSGLPSPPATQVLSFVYAQLANGKLYDFGVGFVALDGYGPLTQIGTGPQQTNGFLAQALVVTGPYLDNGSIVTPVVALSEILSSSVATTLTAKISVGDSTFSVNATGSLSVGDHIIIDDEPFVIAAVHAVPKTIDVTAAAVNRHNNGANVVEAVVLSSSCGSGATNIHASDASVFTPGQSIVLAGTDPVTIDPGWTGGNPIPLVAPGTASSHAAGTVIFDDFASNGISANGISAEVTLAFDLTNQPTDGTFAFVHGWYRVHGGRGKWTDAGAQSAVGSTTDPKTTPARDSYVFGIADLSNGVSYDFAVSMQSFGWYESTKTVIKSNFQAQTINLGVGSLPGMPSGTTITATGSVTGYQGVNGGAYHALFTVVPNITVPSGGLPPAQWLSAFAIYGKVDDTDPPGPGGGDGDGLKKHFALMEVIDAVGFVNGETFNGMTSGLSAGHQYEIAIAPIDGQGNIGPIAIFVVTEAQYIGPGSMSGPNLLQDASFEHVSYFNGTKWVQGYKTFNWPTGAVREAERDPYWSTYEFKAQWQNYVSWGVPGPPIYFGAPVGSQGAGSVQANSDAFHGVTDGNGHDQSKADGCNIQVLSECVKVDAGTTYCYSAYVDASSSVAGSLPGCAAPSIAVINEDHATNLASGSSPGATSFHVNSTALLSVDDVVRIGTGAGIENLEVLGITDATHFTTTVGASNSHSSGDPVDTFWDFQKNDPEWSSLHGGYHPQLGHVLSETSQTFGDRSIISGTFTPTTDTIVSFLFQSHGCKINGILVFGEPQLQSGTAPGPFHRSGGHKDVLPMIAPANADESTGPADLQDGLPGGEGGGYIAHSAQSWQTLAVLSETRDGGDNLIMNSGQVNARHVNAGQIQNQHGATMPGALASSGPTITSSSNAWGTLTAAAQQLSVTLTESDFGALPTWLAAVVLRVRTHGATDWRQEMQLDPGLFSYSLGSGTITAKILNLTAGDVVDVGIAYKDMSGKISATAWPSGVNNASDPDGALLDASSGAIVRPLKSGIPIGAGGPQFTTGMGAPTGTPGVVTVYVRQDPTDFNSALYLYVPSFGWSPVPLVGAS